MKINNKGVLTRIGIIDIVKSEGMIYINDTRINTIYAAYTDDHNLFKYAPKIICNFVTHIIIDIPLISFDTDLSKLTNLTNVEFNNPCGTIERYTFHNCTRLQYVRLPNNIKRILDVFNRCINLINVDFPDDLETIGSRSFHSCISLTTINLSNCSRLQAIESNAFNNCVSLETVILPDRYVKLHNDSFTNNNDIKFLCIIDNTIVTYDKTRYDISEEENDKEEQQCDINSSYALTELIKTIRESESIMNVTI